MENVYLMTEGDVHGYEIDAGHTTFLPGIICPKCGTWARTGAAYPTITKSMLGALLPRLSGKPLALAEFQNLQRDLLEIIGTDRPLFPGSQFDAAVGSVSGRVPDFAWSNPWTLFTQFRVFETMQDRGLHLTGAVAELSSRKRESPPLVEIEAIPRVRLHKSLIAQQDVQECHLCGRMGVRKPKEIVLDETSLDASIPIQRVYELTSLVVNAKFVEVIQDEGLQGVTLVPAKLA